MRRHDQTAERPPMPEVKRSVRPEDDKPAGAFAQQEAALQRVGAQIRAANEKIEGIKQQLQAQISPKKR